MGQCDSGRDILQAQQDGGTALARTTWFDALQSRRRATMIAEVAAGSYELFGRLLQARDWLGAFPELAGRAVWAIDGHQIAHACHAARDVKDEFIPVGQFNPSLDLDLNLFLDFNNLSLLSNNTVGLPQMRTENEEHFVSTDAALLDVDFIHAVLNRTYWAKGRSREVVQESIRNSICFGLYEKAGQRQVGFARIVTDRVTFSWLCDVVVDEKCMRTGLGKFLMSCVVAHPAVSGTLCMLGTSDAHGLYEKYGFMRSDQMKRPRDQGEPHKSADSMISVGAPSAAVPGAARQ